MRGAEQSSTAPTPSIYPIFWINFVGALGFSIVLPFLVFLVTRWGGNALIYGIMGATYSVFQLVGAPILGRWSDVYGRRRILLLSQLGTLASWILFLVALFLPVTPLSKIVSGPLGTFTLTLPLLVLFMARALDGVTGGNISVANAYLADVTPEEQRTVNFGRMALSGNLGFIFGPMLAALLGATVWGEAAPVSAALLISVVATLIIILRLKESSPCPPRKVEAPRVGKVFGQEQRDCYDRQRAEQSGIRDILAIPHIPYLLVMYSLIMLGFNFFYIAFPVHAVRALQWSVRDTGIFFSVMSVCMVLVQGPILSRVSQRFSDVALVVFGSSVLTAAFLLFVDGRIVTIYAGAVLIAVGNGFMWTSLMALLSKSAGSTHQGAVQGFASSCGAVASIVGLVVGGLLYDRLGGSVFALSSVMIALVFIMSWRCRTPRTTPT